MVNYIVLAEFDIEKGSAVRVQYPDAVPGTSAEQLSEYMITEGAHNFGVVSTYFSIGKRSCKDLLTEQARMLQNPQTVLLDKIFTNERRQHLLENFWIPSDQSSTQAQPVRSLPDSIRRASAASDAAQSASDQLSHVTQKARLYRIENMEWTPYFPQGLDRLIEFQLTSLSSQSFTIKLIADPAEPSVAGSGISAAAGSQSNLQSFSIEIKVHPFLNFRSSEAEPFYATFENQQGYIYGVELVNENVQERFNLYKMMKSGLDFDPYQCFEQCMNQSDETIYFFNVLINRHHEQVKRGAIVKALAFGCKQKVLLEPLAMLIQATLDAIINAMDFNAPEETNMIKYQQIIQKVHQQVNIHASNLLAHRGNFLERAVSQDLSTNCAWRPSRELHFALQGGGPSPDSLIQDQVITIELDTNHKLQTPVTIPLATSPDQVTQSSLVNFINYFGQQTMVIYDAILTDKRIIFAGSRNLSITQIQNYLFAAASMVSPPLYGIHNKIRPYVPLVEMQSLQGDEGFIAGVTNPMFIENRRLYDVSIQIDEGRLHADSSIKREPYFDLDMEFIQTLLTRIRNNNITDDEVKQAFQSYTQLMLDMATNLAYSNNSADSGGMTHQGKPLSQMYLNRTRKIKNTHLFRTHLSMQKIMDLDMSHSITLTLIKQHMRTLRIKGVPTGPLNDYEVGNIFRDIDSFLQNRTSAVKLLFMLPMCRQGVGLLAHGLFFDDQRTQRLAARILSKIQRSCKAGNLAVNRLSEFLKMRLFDVLMEIDEEARASQPSNNGPANANIQV